jgi:hypothetical protein
MARRPSGDLRVVGNDLRKPGSRLRISRHEHRERILRQRDGSGISAGEIFEQQHGGAVGSPIVTNGGGDRDGRGAGGEAAESDVSVAVAIEVAGVHGNPAAGFGFGRGVGLEAEVVARAGAGEIDKAFDGFR